VQSKELTPFVAVSGTVTYDTRRFAAVGARIPGRVRRVFKVTGDEVKPNQPLAEIESADLGRAEALVASARAKESAAEAQMKRERKLADARISAERDAELAKAEYEAARAERIASERAVVALGGDLEGEIGILTLRSPVAGKVVAGKAVRGQTVDPKDTLFEVADLGTLWVELRLFERDLASVRVGDVVELAAPAAGGREIKGTVQHVGDVVDVETRTAAVRIVVENRERALRPGQAVHARIHTRSPAGRQVAVPRGAVTRVDGRPTVFVMIDGETVEPRTVKLGAEDHDEVAILEGVRQGEKVVTGGLFALKSEIFR
jgi:cobalt-zinc-cadmium efflux system membrane fusion protein